MSNLAYTNAKSAPLAPIKKIKTALKSIETANAILTSAEQFNQLDHDYITQAAEQFSETLHSYLDVTALPKEFQDIIANSISNLKDGSAPYAVQIHACADEKSYIDNDANGNDHYRFSLEFLNVEGDVELGLYTTFTEVRDVDGWDFEPSINSDALTIKYKGNVLDALEVSTIFSVVGCDIDTFKTSAFQLMEALHEDATIPYIPTPALIQESMDIIRKNVAAMMTSALSLKTD
jgi:hypothetical protein